MNYRVTVLGEVYHNAHNWEIGFLVDIHSTKSRPIYCFMIQFIVSEGLNEHLFELHVRVDTETIFGNLQCRNFNCSSCRCLYRLHYEDHIDKNFQWTLEYLMMKCGMWSPEKT